MAYTTHWSRLYAFNYFFFYFAADLHFIKANHSRYKHGQLEPCRRTIIDGQLYFRNGKHTIFCSLLAFWWPILRWWFATNANWFCHSSDLCLNGQPRATIVTSELTHCHWLLRRKSLSVPSGGLWAYRSSSAIQPPTQPPWAPSN